MHTFFLLRFLRLHRVSIPNTDGVTHRLHRITALFLFIFFWIISMFKISDCNHSAIRFIWTKTTNRLHSAAPSKMDRAHSMTRCPFTKSKRSKHSTISLTVWLTDDSDAIVWDISFWRNLSGFQLNVKRLRSELNQLMNGGCAGDRDKSKSSDSKTKRHYFTASPCSCVSLDNYHLFKTLTNVDHNVRSSLTALTKETGSCGQPGIL